LDDANKTIQLDSHAIKAYFRAGKAAYELKRYEDANEYYYKGLRLENSANSKPTSVAKEFQRGIDLCTAQLKKKQTPPPAKKEDVFEKPRPKAIPSPEIIQPELGDTAGLSQEELIKQFKQSIAQMEKSFSEGKLRQTKNICETILSLIPSEKVSSHYLGTILLAARRYERAISVLRPACDAHPDEKELLINYAEALFGHREYQEALRILTQCAKDIKSDSSPDAQRINLRIARCLLKMDNPEVAGQLIVVRFLFLIFMKEV
jgi:tetratricopeptide (TPR) repeat protein